MSDTNVCGTAVLDMIGKNNSWRINLHATILYMDSTVQMFIYHDVDIIFEMRRNFLLLFNSLKIKKEEDVTNVVTTCVQSLLLFLQIKICLN